MLLEVMALKRYVRNGFGSRKMEPSERLGYRILVFSLLNIHEIKPIHPNFLINLNN
jgi:hypothetical protein